MTTLNYGNLPPTLPDLSAGSTEAKPQASLRTIDLTSAAKLEVAPNRLGALQPLSKTLIAQVSSRSSGGVGTRGGILLRPGGSNNIKSFSRPGGTSGQQNRSPYQQAPAARPSISSPGPVQALPFGAPAQFDVYTLVTVLEGFFNQNGTEADTLSRFGVSNQEAKFFVLHSNSEELEKLSGPGKQRWAKIGNKIEAGLLRIRDRVMRPTTDIPSAPPKTSNPLSSDNYPPGNDTQLPDVPTQPRVDPAEAKAQAEFGSTRNQARAANGELVKAQQNYQSAYARAQGKIADFYWATTGGQAALPALHQKLHAVQEAVQGLRNIYHSANAPVANLKALERQLSSILSGPGGYSLSGGSWQDQSNVFGWQMNGDSWRSEVSSRIDDISRWLESARSYVSDLTKGGKGGTSDILPMLPSQPIYADKGVAQAHNTASQTQGKAQQARFNAPVQPVTSTATTPPTATGRAPLATVAPKTPNSRVHPAAGRPAPAEPILEQWIDPATGATSARPTSANSIHLRMVSALPSSGKPFTKFIDLATGQVGDTVPGFSVKIEGTRVGSAQRGEIFVKDPRVNSPAGHSDKTLVPIYYPNRRGNWSAKPVAGGTLYGYYEQESGKFFDKAGNKIDPPGVNNGGNGKDGGGGSGGVGGGGGSGSTGGSGGSEDPGATPPGKQNWWQNLNDVQRWTLEAIGAGVGVVVLNATVDSQTSPTFNLTNAEALNKKLISAVTAGAAQPVGTTTRSQIWNNYLSDASAQLRNVRTGIQLPRFSAEELKQFDDAVARFKEGLATETPLSPTDRSTAQQSLLFSPGFTYNDSKKQEALTTLVNMVNEKARDDVRRLATKVFGSPDATPTFNPKALTATEVLEQYPEITDVNPAKSKTALQAAEKHVWRHFLSQVPAAMSFTPQQKAMYLDNLGQWLNSTASFERAGQRLEPENVGFSPGMALGDATKGPLMRDFVEAAHTKARGVINDLRKKTPAATSTDLQSSSMLNPSAGTVGGNSNSRAQSVLQKLFGITAPSEKPKRAVDLTKDPQTLRDQTEVTEFKAKTDGLIQSICNAINKSQLPGQPAVTLGSFSSYAVDKSKFVALADESSRSALYDTNTRLVALIKELDAQYGKVSSLSRAMTVAGVGDRPVGNDVGNFNQVTIPKFQSIRLGLSELQATIVRQINALSAPP
jgi:hypothetical protein